MRKNRTPVTVRDLISENAAPLVFGSVAISVSSLLLLLIPNHASQLILQLPYFDMQGLILIVSLFIMYAVVSFVGTYLFGRVSAQTIIRLRKIIYTRFLCAIIPFHDQENSADLVSRLTSDTVFIHQSLSAIIPVLAQHIPIVLVAFFLMLKINTPLTLIILIGVTPPLVVPFWLGKKIRHNARESQHLVGQVAVLAQESLGAIRFVKANVLETYFQNRLNDKLNRLFQKLKQRAFWSATIEGLLPLSALSALLWFLWIVQRYLTSTQITLGQTLTLAGFLIVAANSSYRLMGTYSQIENMLGAATRIVQLSQMHILLEPTSGTSVPNIRGGITFEHVTFQYQNASDGLFDITLHINPGEFVAITGANGAGKSTLIHLLLRFYEPQEGRICLDDYSSTDSDIQSWRRQIVLVSRDPVIFGVSIGENIALPKPLTSQQAVENAAKAVKIHDFIQELPEGYDTLVGENGVTLSSGQKQLIALARIFFHDPPIIILDEAITSLDVQAEKTLRNALVMWAGKKTVIFVSHSPIVRWPVDRIISLKQGRIVNKIN